MLQVNNLTFGYSRRKPPVLDDFSLTIEKGGVYGLLGPNGAGKSTLLHLIAGALTPRAGKVMYNGVDTRRRLPETLRDIFIVPEEFSLPPVSLEKYVSLNAPLYPRFSRETMERNLDMFEMPKDINLGALSMGQKKKVFMSFALACNTSLMLMDEPTNGLDIPGKSAFRRFIGSSLDDDRAIIISTHQVRDIDRILDNVLIMDRHRVVFEQPVYEIQKRLRFVVSADNSLFSKSLYTVPGINGAAMILPNDGCDDTEINLELLFDFALRYPERLTSIFENV